MDAQTSSLAQTRRWLPVLAVGLLLTVSSSVWAAPVPWSNASGSNSRFGWSNGQSDDGGLGGSGLWGNPVVTPPGFYFGAMSPNFRAEATDPESDNMLSSMSVVLSVFSSTPPNAPSLTELRIEEWGTFTGDVSDVEATGGTVLLTSLNPARPPKNLGELNMRFDTENGTWRAWMDIDFAAIGGTFPAAVKILSVDVTNHLKAIPTGGRTASIQKTGATVTVPEPATGMFVLCGLVTLVARRAGRGSRRA